MKLRELERHLRTHGCVLFREGGAHTVWLNRSTRKIASVRDTVKSKKERPVAFVGSLKSRGYRHFDLEFVNPRSYLRCFAWLLWHDFRWAFHLRNRRRIPFTRQRIFFRSIEAHGQIECSTFIRS